MPQPIPARIAQTTQLLVASRRGKRRRTWRLRSVGIAALLTLCITLTTGVETGFAQSGDTPSWRAIAPDLETTVVSTGPFSADLVLVRTQLKRYRIEVIQASVFGSPRGSVNRLTESAGAILGINANFFDEIGRPLGLVVSRGKGIQRLHGGGKTLTGVFAIDSNGPRIDSRISYSPTGVREAIQAGPRLIANGAAVHGLKSSGAAARRAGVCIDNAQRVIFFVVSSGFLGLTFDELQRILIRPGIDCRDALNLDGGGSAQLRVNPGIVQGGLKTAEIFIPGADEVPVILGLFPLESR